MYYMLTQSLLGTSGDNRLHPYVSDGQSRATL